MTTVSPFLSSSSESLAHYIQPSSLNSANSIAVKDQSFGPFNPSDFSSSASMTTDTSTLMNNADSSAATAPDNSASSSKAHYPKTPYTGKGKTSNSQKGNEGLARFKALTEKVKDIQVSLVMPLLGAEGNQDRDRSKWKIMGVGNISVSGQRWWNLNLDKGGVGPINLVMHTKDLKFSEAVRWLAQEFGEQVDQDDIKASLEDLNAPKEKKIFEPPLRDDKNLPFVKHYLHFNRGIPMELINELIEQHRIYADERRTCIFYSDGIAEMRSAFDEGEFVVKRLAKGSTRSTGFLVKADPAQNERTIVVCESAIDSMSYRSMHPGCSVFSSAGAVREFPRKIAEEAILNEYGFVAAFDADEAGDKASQNLFNHFYTKLWVQHRIATDLKKTIDDESLLELMLDGIVDFDLLTLPEAPDRNLLFFNDPDPFSDPKRPPVIMLTIKKNTWGLPECKNYEMPVSQKGFEFITETLKLRRDRPVIGKDWNEEILNQRAKLRPGF